MREKDGLIILRGTLLNPVSDTECEYYFDALIVARSAHGVTTIEEVGEASCFEKSGQVVSPQSCENPKPRG